MRATVPPVLTQSENPAPGTSVLTEKEDVRDKLARAWDEAERVHPQSTAVAPPVPAEREQPLEAPPSLQDMAVAAEIEALITKTWNVLFGSDESSVRTRSSSIRKRKAALKLINQILMMDPGHPEGYNLMGLLLSEEENYDAAILLYRTAIALKPDEAAYHNNLGIALQATGNHPGAVAAFRSALKLQPKLAELHLNLGSTLAAAGEANEAVAEYQAAHRLAQPADTGFWHTGQ